MAKLQPSTMNKHYQSYMKIEPDNSNKAVPYLWGFATLAIFDGLAIAYFAEELWEAIVLLILFWASALFAASAMEEWKGR
jgi:ATP/ADP translocase